MRAPAAAAVLLLLSSMTVATLLSGCAPVEGQTRRDYLSGDLRAKIEALKSAVAAEPTSAATAPERSAVLWQWANAFALDGRVLPINVPPSVRQVTLAAHERRPVPPGLQRQIDLFVRELQFKEDRPDALGTLRFAGDQPLAVGGFVTVEEIYTVGSQPLELGATLAIGRQFMPDQGEVQHEDPAADHYVSLRSSDPSVRWERLRVALAGLHSTRDGGSANLAFRLTAGRLDPGATVTLTFGDRSGGSRGFQVQTFATDLLLLPIYVDLTGDGLFLSPRWPSLKVIGQPEVSAVRAFAPSIVAPGEPFELSVRSEDRWFNRASGPIPAYTLLLDGKPWRELAASRDAVQVVAGVSLDAPGVHRFTVRSADGRVTASSNPVWVRQDAGRRVYWGETHGHCGFGEGQGSAEGFYRFAREDSRLDFATLTEHDALLDDDEWRQVNELTERFAEDGRFVPFAGYEWSGQRTEGGHHNVIFREPGHRRVPLQTNPVLPLLYGGLRAGNDLDDVLIIPHAHNAGDWTQNDAQLEKLVEVSSLHGTFEWFGNLYLESGFEVGFVGASDDHRTNPGMPLALPRPFQTQKSGVGAVWAGEKSRDAIFDALRSLSAYATTGERILLDAALNGHPMGSRQQDTPERRIECQVAGTSPIDRIEVVKNGAVVFGRSYLAAPLASRSTLQIGFQSSSEVFFPPYRDNPRPQRVWDGTLEVEGARIVGVETPGFDNHYSELARVEDGRASRVRFLTQTRGRMDTLLLQLDGAGPQTVIRFHLEPRTETGSKAGNVRPAADLPGADFELRLDGLVDSRMERDFQVDLHTDRIKLQVIDPAAALDRELEFTDLEDVEPPSNPHASMGHGDYYYVRVTQLDGGQAFSSPFWVGAAGRPPREPDTKTGGGVD